MVLTPSFAMVSAMDILDSLLAVIARFRSCVPAWKHAFA